MIELKEGDICMFCRESRIRLVQGKETEHLACSHCDSTYCVGATIETSDALRQENEQLRAEAKLGNIPYAEAIKTKDQLKQAVGYLKFSGAEAHHNTCPAWQGEICDCGLSDLINSLEGDK